MLDKLKEILGAMDSNLYYGQVAKAPENWKLSMAKQEKTALLKKIQKGQ